MEKLSLVLWKERELLETLSYRLEIEQMVLAQGRTHWLMRAAKDVEEVLTTLREVEVLRAVAAADAAEAVGLPMESTLREIAARCPEPWGALLMDHHDAFSSITRHIIDMAGANRHLLTQGYQSARETLLSFQESAPATYTPDGAAVTADVGARVVDRSL